MKKTVYGIFALGAMAAFVWAPFRIFYEAPIQKTVLFFNQKIFYYHVPCASMLFLAVIICGVASFGFLKTRKGVYDDVALAAGDCSILFGAITLLTGMIWAKPAWNVWWQWDARLTMSLLLWMTMVGYVLVRRYGGLGAERLAAGLAFLGSVNVPLVYFSVKIWRTFHPPTSTVPNLPTSMAKVFGFCMLTFLVFFVLLLILRTKIAENKRRIYACNEQGLDAGLF